MKFFFPDAHDLVDPSFDFRSESRTVDRIRQRDERYAHEILAAPPYDGILLSKGIVDGLSGGQSKYTVAQRRRLLRDGAKRFFRLVGTSYEMMGDCGAFSYVHEERPPYGVAEVAEFYSQCGVDYGISVDHVILEYDASLDERAARGVPAEWRRRQELTLGLAGAFLRYRNRHRYRFAPMGVAQGWSPGSYAKAVSALERMGFEYIALGGIVPLKTAQVLDCLRRISEVRRERTRLHLLGVTRCEHMPIFAEHGVVSFDSTSPLRQAFKDAKDNYHTRDGSYVAVRVPQIDGNVKLKQRIAAGIVDQGVAQRLERNCLEGLTSYGARQTGLKRALDAVVEYEKLCDGQCAREEQYRTVLQARPWERCSCQVCRHIGIQVVIFRGAERNRRRGFHNLHVLRGRLQGLGLCERD
jgi:hypothetical protein